MIAVFSKHAISRLRTRFGVCEKVGQRWLSEARDAKPLELLMDNSLRTDSNRRFMLSAAKGILFILENMVTHWLVVTCVRHQRAHCRLKRKQRRELSLYEELLPEAAR